MTPYYRHSGDVVRAQEIRRAEWDATPARTWAIVAGAAIASGLVAQRWAEREVERIEVLLDFIEWRPTRWDLWRWGVECAFISARYRFARFFDRLRGWVLNNESVVRAAIYLCRALGEKPSASRVNSVIEMACGKALRRATVCSLIKYIIESENDEGKSAREPFSTPSREPFSSASGTVSADSQKHGNRSGTDRANSGTDTEPFSTPSREPFSSTPGTVFDDTSGTDRANSGTDPEHHVRGSNLEIENGNPRLASLAAREPAAVENRARMARFVELGRWYLEAGISAGAIGSHLAIDPGPLGYAFKHQRAIAALVEAHGEREFCVRAARFWRRCTTTGKGRLRMEPTPTRLAEHWAWFVTDDVAGEQPGGRKAFDDHDISGGSNYAAVIASRAESC